MSVRVYGIYDRIGRKERGRVSWRSHEDHASRLDYGVKRYKVGKECVMLNFFASTMYFKIIRVVRTVKCIMCLHFENKQIAGPRKRPVNPTNAMTALEFLF